MNVNISASEVTNNEFIKNIYSTVLTGRRYTILYINKNIEIEIPFCGPFNKFKMQLNTIHLKCSDRFITIMDILSNNSRTIRFSYFKFLNLVKYFRNVKISDFSQEITDEDLIKYDKLIGLIPITSDGSIFDYKMLRFYKTKHGINVSIIGLDRNSINKFAVILYLKSFDKTLDQVINSCQIKALSNI